MDQAEVAGRRRRLARLALARADITAALSICELTLSQESLADHDSRYLPFHYAVVVSYGRPFTDNKPLGPLPAKWSRFDERRLQDAHEALMMLRHGTVAHSDLSHRPVLIIAKGTPLGGGAVAPSTLVTVQNKAIMNRASFEAMRDLCLNHLPKLSAAIDTEYVALFPDGYDGVEPLVLAWDDSS